MQIAGNWRRRAVLAALVALGGAVTLLLVLSSKHTAATAADHFPADKVTVAANQAVVSGPGQAVTLLTGKLRTSTPADLQIAVTSECTIATDVTTVGNDDQSAEGLVKMWVEIDGKPVPVSSTPKPDDGQITFCNAAHHRKTSMFDDTNATIETMDKYGDSNAFNWTALNVGNGIHTLTLKGELTETASNRATADAAVGKRTMTVLPGHMANDAAF